MDIVKIVKGDNLNELIENALSGYHMEYYEVLNYQLKSGVNQTIVTGKVNIGYWNNEEYIEDTFNFEVNIGTHKEDLVLFDEFEVVVN